MKVPDNLEVVLASDAEGNQIRKVGFLSWKELFFLKKASLNENLVSREDFQEMGVSEHDKDIVPCLCIWPED